MLDELPEEETEVECDGCRNPESECECCEDCGNSVNEHSTCQACGDCTRYNGYECDFCNLYECCCQCIHARCGCTIPEDYLCDDCCACQSCCGCRSFNETPIFDHSDIRPLYYAAQAIYDTLQDECRSVCPAESMADFYLTDYILAHAVSPSPDVALALNEAKSIQDAIITKLDPIFRRYLIAAIGGELRYHPAVRDELPTDDRSRTSGIYLALAHHSRHSACELLENAQDLFNDYSAWEDGYGGSAWASIADVASLRECNKIDARTFVDRVFNLQHNNGTCLSKAKWSHSRMSQRFGWIDVSTSCERVGQLHSSRTPHLGALAAVASPEVSSLLRRFALAYNKQVRHLGSLCERVTVEPLPTECRFCQYQRDAYYKHHSEAIDNGDEYAVEVYQNATCSAHGYYPQDNVFTAIQSLPEFTGYTY